MSQLDKRLAFGFYMAAFILVFVFGTRMINFGLDLRLYNDFLAPWKDTYEECRRIPAQWPDFLGDNHVAHMDELVRVMKMVGVSPPDSNTDKTYIFEMNKFWHEKQRIFVLCRVNQLIIYGISVTTAHRIDRLVDDRSDLEKGWFTATESKDGQTYIGYWKL